MRAVVVLSLCLVAVPAVARVDHSVNISNLSTADLAADCGTSETMPMSENLCLGYSLGVLDVMIAEGEACTDTNFRASQGVAVARKYLRDHPEQWNMHPLIVLTMAYTAAFPCRK